MPKSRLLLDISDGLITHARVIVAVLPVTRVSGTNLIAVYVDLPVIRNLGVIISVLRYLAKIICQRTDLRSLIISISCHLTSVLICPNHIHSNQVCSFS